MINKCILDASVALAWCIEDEKNPYSSAVLNRVIKGGEVLVPALWRYEVVNIFLKSERRKRITREDIDTFIEDLSEVEYEVEITTYLRAFTTILELGYKERLRFHDAAYVELALLKGLPIATLDKGMISAARSLGIPLFLEDDSWSDYAPHELVAYLQTDYSSPKVEKEPVAV